MRRGNVLHETPVPLRVWGTATVKYVSLPQMCRYPRCAGIVLPRPVTADRKRARTRSRRAGAGSLAGDV